MHTSVCEAIFPQHACCTRVQRHKCTRKTSQGNTLAESAGGLGDMAGLRGAGRRQPLSLQPWQGSGWAPAPRVPLCHPNIPNSVKGKALLPRRGSPAPTRAGKVSGMSFQHPDRAESPPLPRRGHPRQSPAEPPRPRRLPQGRAAKVFPCPPRAPRLPEPREKQGET